MGTVPGMRIELVPADPAWPDRFAVERDAIVDALAEVAVRVEHVGSTSVPGLAAKPTIDIVLCVPDSTDEAAYVPALEAEGFVFLLREPEWFEHRLLRREPRRTGTSCRTTPTRRPTWCGRSNGAPESPPVQSGE